MNGHGVPSFGMHCWIGGPIGIAWDVCYCIGFKVSTPVEVCYGIEASVEDCSLVISRGCLFFCGWRIKVGGSNGTVFAWDLRWRQQPILLSGAGLGESVQPPSESEVWEVQCDSYVLSAFSSAPPSTKSLPVMICSEDGVLAVLGQGEEPIELLAENCAINSFNIDPRSPPDVVCALEWESIAILMRSREPFAAY